MTDGARGIGYAIAQRFVEEGAKVAITAIYAKTAKAAVRDLEQAGGRAIGSPLSAELV